MIKIKEFIISISIHSDNEYKTKKIEREINDIGVPFKVIVQDKTGVNSLGEWFIHIIAFYN